jgi:hypothetical protein
MKIECGEKRLKGTQVEQFFLRISFANIFFSSKERIFYIKIDEEKKEDDKIILPARRTTKKKEKKCSTAIII